MCFRRSDIQIRLGQGWYENVSADFKLMLVPFVPLLICSVSSSAPLPTVAAVITLVIVLARVRVVLFLLVLTDGARGPLAARLLDVPPL